MSSAQSYGFLRIFFSSSPTFKNNPVNALFVQYVPKSALTFCIGVPNNPIVLLYCSTPLLYSPVRLVQASFAENPNPKSFFNELLIGVLKSFDKSLNVWALS